MDNIKMGNFLQTLRKSSGYTQKDIADRFSISNKTVSKWECGDTIPEIPLLCALAEFYDVTVDEILKGEKNNSFKEPTVTVKKDTNLNDYFVKKRINRIRLLNIIALALIIIGIAVMEFIYSISFKCTLSAGVGYLIFVASFIVFVINMSFSSSGLEEYLDDEQKQSFKLVIMNNVYVFLSFFITAVISGYFYNTAYEYGEPFFPSLITCLISGLVFFFVYSWVRASRFKDGVSLIYRRYVFLIWTPFIMGLLFSPALSIFFDGQYIMIKITTYILSMLFLIILGIYFGFMIRKIIYKIEYPKVIDRFESIDRKIGLIFILILFFSTVLFIVSPYFFYTYSGNHGSINDSFYLFHYDYSVSSGFLSDMLIPLILYALAIICWLISLKKHQIYYLSYLLLGASLFELHSEMFSLFQRSYYSSLENYDVTPQIIYYWIILYGFIGIIYVISKSISKKK